MGHAGELYLYARSCTYKYKKFVNSYRDVAWAQYRSRQFPTICWISDMSSCCTISGTYHMTFSISAYNPHTHTHLLNVSFEQRDANAKCNKSRWENRWTQEHSLTLLQHIYVVILSLLCSHNVILLSLYSNNITTSML